MGEDQQGEQQQPDQEAEGQVPGFDHDQRARAPSQRHSERR